MIEFETEALEIIGQTHDVKTFRFKIEKPVSFKPGQFFFVTIKINDEEKTKHFSFSNSPTENKYVEFTKRITKSEYSQALDKLKPGDWARLKLPVGQFTFEGEHKKIAFISGGIGVTPARSILKFIADKHIDTDVVLLFGNSTEKDIIFKKDFDEISENNRNIHVFYTLTSPYVDTKTWHGKTGYINDNMISELIPDYKERIFYISGPPKMVETMTAILKDSLKQPEEKIKTENFVGY